MVEPRFSRPANRLATVTDETQPIRSLLRKLKTRGHAGVGERTLTYDVSTTHIVEF